MLREFASDVVVVAGNAPNARLVKSLGRAPPVALADDRDGEANACKERRRCGRDVPAAHDQTRNERTDGFDDDLYAAAAAHAELGAEMKASRGKDRFRISVGRQTSRRIAE